MDQALSTEVQTFYAGLVKADPTFANCSLVVIVVKTTGVFDMMTNDKPNLDTMLEAAASQKRGDGTAVRPM